MSTAVKNKPKAQAQSVTALLNQSLATTLDLKLQLKQAHWNVTGENFIALHELFDRVATDVDGYADQLAERSVQLGMHANGLVSDVARNSKLTPFPTGINDSAKYVRVVAAALRKAADLTREAIDLSAEQGDAVTADIFTQITGGLDKLRWFVEAHQK